MSIAPEPLKPDDTPTFVDPITASTSRRPTVKLEAEKYMPLDDVEDDPPFPITGDTGPKKLKADKHMPRDGTEVAHGGAEVHQQAHHDRTASLIPGACAWVRVVDESPSLPSFGVESGLTCEASPCWR